MGTGNFQPRGYGKETHQLNGVAFEMVYVPIQGHQWIDERSLLELKIQSALREYTPIVEQKWLWGDDEIIIVEGDNTIVTTADNMWSVAIIIRALDPKNPDRKEMETMKELIGKLLRAQGYDMYVRSGPWTSNKVEVW